MPFPKPAPVFMLVMLPPDENQGDIIEAAEALNGSAKRVDQHALLVQLLVRATPAMRALAAQVFNDPENPKWDEHRRGCDVCRANPAPGPGLACRACGEES